MNAQDLARAGRLGESLSKLQEEVRASPGDEKLRVFLFQLLSVLGKWDRALAQLEVLAGLSANAAMLARIFEPVVRCEVLRGDIFAGKRTPVIFGQPEEWMGWLIKANEMTAAGKAAAAAELRAKAFDAAPATPGTINGKPFEWIADADQRLGPLLEVILEGKYYWIPFQRIRRIHVEKPTDMRDLVWIPAQFVWTNGGEGAGHVPTRYPQTELAPDDALRLARKTEWPDTAGGFGIGLGQRILATDSDEYPLLECGVIDLQGVESRADGVTAHG
jgi:type VI secretion system protein ImpE